MFFKKKKKEEEPVTNPFGEERVESSNNVEETHNEDLPNQSFVELVPKDIPYVMPVSPVENVDQPDEDLQPEMQPEIQNNVELQPEIQTESVSIENTEDFVKPTTDTKIDYKNMSVDELIQDVKETEYCPNCGSKVQPTDEYCNLCGAPL